MILVVAAFAIGERPRTAAIAGFASGFVRDLLLTTPTGLSAFAYAATAYGVALIGVPRGVGPVVGMFAGATFVSQLHLRPRCGVPRPPGGRIAAAADAVRDHGVQCAPLPPADAAAEPRRARRGRQQPTDRPDAMSPNISPIRLAVVHLLVLSLLATLVGRLWYLQVLTGGEAQELAERTSIRFVYEQAPRGFMFDRKVERWRATAPRSPSRSTCRASAGGRKDQVIRDLAHALDMTQDEVRDIVDDNRIGPHTPRPIALDVDKDVVDRAARASGAVPRRDAPRDPRARVPDGCARVARRRPHRRDQRGRARDRRGATATRAEERRDRRCASTAPAI